MAWILAADCSKFRANVQRVYGELNVEEVYSTDHLTSLRALLDIHHQLLLL